MNGFTSEDLNTILESTGTPYWKLDLSSHFLTGNDRFFNILGIVPEKDNQISWDDFLIHFTPESTDGIAQSLSLHLEVGLPFEVRLLQNTPAGVKNRDLTGMALRSPSGTAIAVNGVLKSDEARVETADFEKMISDHQRMILKTSRMSALGEMASGIAHEVNNPLAIIFGKIDKIQRLMTASQEVPTETILTDLKKIQDTSNRIAKIIKGLRAFSRSGEQDPFENASIELIINDTLSFCRERILNHQIELRLPEKLSEFEISCRATQISQVMLNLLNNAYDAIVDRPGEKWIEISTQTLNEKLLVSVTDSGSGISPEISDKLMQPFFTTKEAGKGTGLGLSISKGIIEEHRGQLYYDGTSTHTRFVIELPLKPKKN